MFLIAAIVLGVPTLIASILSQAELWQRKEYRWDRLRAALIGPELKTALLIYLVGLFITSLGWLARSVNYSTLGNFLGLTGLAFIFGYQANRFLRRGLFRPDLTNKAKLLLVIIGAVTLSYLWLAAPPTTALHWATTIMLLPLFTVISVLLVNAIGYWQKQQIIRRARVLRTSLPDMKVVGITGSYGKTSTKHFLSQLVPDATVSEAHRNADFTIAQDMLEQLKPGSKTYIVEMGAYRSGEITKLVTLTQPVIAIITAISNQHLGLFGSPQKLAQAKWELINGLPPTGTAVLNADDQAINKRGQSIALNTIWYSSKSRADVYATDVTFKPRHILATIHIQQDSRQLHIPLLAEGMLASALAAAAGALALKVKTDDIFLGLTKLKPVPQTMQLISRPGTATIIDDSYSANEQGVLMAINHLKRFTESDKRIVLPPLIELGEEAKAVHQRIGQALASVPATVYIYGKSYQPQLSAPAAQKDSRARLHFIDNPQHLVRRISSNLTSDTVILLAGRVPAIVRASLNIT